MDLMSEEFIRLTAAFEKYGLKYIIVGGFAVNRHGYNRSTGDLDIYLRDDSSNRKALIAALEAMGYGRFEMLMTVPFIAGYCEIMMDTGIYADLMSELPGFSKQDFDTCYEMALVDMVQGVPVRFLHYKQLIENKKATGRKKDLLDVEELEKLHGKRAPGDAPH